MRTKFYPITSTISIKGSTIGSTMPSWSYYSNQKRGVFDLILPVKKEVADDTTCTPCTKPCTKPLESAPGYLKMSMQPCKYHNPPFHHCTRPHCWFDHSGSVLTPTVSYDCDVYVKNIPPSIDKPFLRAMADECCKKGGKVLILNCHNSNRTDGFFTCNAHFSQASAALQFVAAINKQPFTDTNEITASINAIDEYIPATKVAPNRTYASASRPRSLPEPEPKPVPIKDKDGFTTAKTRRGKPSFYAVLQLSGSDDDESSSDEKESKGSTTTIEEVTFVAATKTDKTDEPATLETPRRRTITFKDEVVEKLRVAPDGNPYTEIQFEDYFRDGGFQWGKAPPYEPRFVSTELSFAELFTGQKQHYTNQEVAAGSVENPEQVVNESYDYVESESEYDSNEEPEYDSDVEQDYSFTTNEISNLEMAKFWKLQHIYK